MAKFDEFSARKAVLLAPNCGIPQNVRRDAYSDEWYTPARIVQALGLFDLDPCAGPMSHARINYRLPGRNGLRLAWHGRVWMNPPYSSVHRWLELFATHANGIALVNARTEMIWFQRFVAGSSCLLWLRRRIRFERPGAQPGNPTVGSVLVAYGEENAEALRRCGLPGILTTGILRIEAAARESASLATRHSPLATNH